MFVYFYVNQNNTADVRREAAIRCLVVYLGEKEEDLFVEYNVSAYLCI